MNAHAQIARKELGAKATPERARERADDLQQAADGETSRMRADALYRKAEALREWANDTEQNLEQIAAGDATASPSSGDEVGKASKRGGKAGKAGGGSSRKSSRAGKRLGSAARRATVGEPVEALSGGIVSTGSMFWRIVGMTFVLVLLYRLFLEQRRTAALLGSVSKGVEAVVYPRKAFPNRANKHRGATK